MKYRQPQLSAFSVLVRGVASTPVTDYERQQPMLAPFLLCGPTNPGGSITRDPATQRRTRLDAFAREATAP